MLKISLRLLSPKESFGFIDDLNVQGLAQKAKKDWVRELCIKNKVNFVGLQETKMESIDMLSVRSCWGNLTFGHVHKFCLIKIIQRV